MTVPLNMANIPDEDYMYEKRVWKGFKEGKRFGTGFEKKT